MAADCEVLVCLKVMRYADRIGIIEGMVRGCGEVGMCLRLSRFPDRVGVFDTVARGCGEAGSGRGFRELRSVSMFVNTCLWVARR